MNMHYKILFPENHDYLKKFLVELAPPARSSKIIDWQIGGLVFLDYINLCEMLDKLKQDLQSERVC